MGQAALSSVDQALAIDIASFYADPLGHVIYSYAWGSGALRGEVGPDEWQREELENIGAEVRRREAAGDDPDAILSAIRIAVASGHGIGKTCFISWVLLWFISTRPHCQIVTTANTKSQLSTKTWRELAKWHRLAIFNHWFKWTATRFYAREAPDTWFAAAIPWSKDKPEAFAGTHEKHVLFLFDEASIIDDVIWEVSEGAMTTPGAMWIAFGNPTRNTGRFRECFGKYRHRWINRRIDSRDAKKANQAQIQEWIDDYGDDSDFARVRIKGEFPRAGDMQLIPVDIVEQAMARTLEPSMFANYPKMLGVDVARFGDDRSVILRRQGTKVWKPCVYREIDTMTLVGYVADEARDFGAATVFVDGVGMGGPVVDRLRQLGMTVVDVQAGAQAVRKNEYLNLRAELWARMRDWVKGEVDLPEGYNDLRDDLIAPEYGFDGKMRLQLEKKADMKRRGLASPDVGDALALTFADFQSQGNRARTIKRVRWA